MLTAEQPTSHENSHIYDAERRHHNDAETYLAEVLDGNMRTKFEFTFDGNDLYADDGSSMGDVFRKAEIDGERIAKKDPRLSFEPRRRKLESEEYQCMLAMARGELPNTMIVVSDFPEELLGAKKGIGGYNVDRKQAMLRVITWDGQKIAVRSQSLDRSDPQALDAIYESQGLRPKPGERLGQRIHDDVDNVNQEFLIDYLTGVYDRSLSALLGGKWYAGRSPAEMENTYNFVKRNQDIAHKLAGLFAQDIYTGPEVYDCGVALQNRFTAFKNGAYVKEVYKPISEWDIAEQQRLEQEMRFAGIDARARGVTLDACGSSNDGNDVADQLEASGYGNKNDKDAEGDCEFISKVCPSCGQRNVKTVSRKRGSRLHVSGSCGCSKTY